jgi:hypothetical protein
LFCNVAAPVDFFFTLKCRPNTILEFLHFPRAADDERRALMNVVWFDVENLPLAVGRRAARLLG